MSGEGTFEVVGRAVTETGAGELQLKSNVLAVYQIRDGRASRPPAHLAPPARMLVAPAKTHRPPNTARPPACLCVTRTTSANQSGVKDRYISYVFRDGKMLPKGKSAHLLFLTFDFPPAKR